MPLRPDPIHPGVLRTPLIPTRPLPTLPPRRPLDPTPPGYTRNIHPLRCDPRGPTPTPRHPNLAATPRPPRPFFHTPPWRPRITYHPSGAITTR